MPWLTGTPSNGGSARLWRGAIRDGDTSRAKPRAYDVAGAWRSVSHVAGGKRVGACAPIFQNAALCECHERARILVVSLRSPDV